MGDSVLDHNMEAQVMSEVHIGKDPAAASCLSLFTIASQPLSSSNGKVAVRYDPRLNIARDEKCCKDVAIHNVSVDEMGDLVSRHKRSILHEVPVEEDIITIFHQLKTSILHVGLQVWRGALLLSDFLIHKIRTTNELDNVTALELGAGTGLAGIVLAQKAKLVFLTDRGLDVLNNCFRNANINLQHYRRGEDTIRVRELDWQGSWPPPTLLKVEPLDDDPQKQNPYSWTRSDLQEIKEASIILAADVIYDDDLTEAFFSTLLHLLPPGSNKVLLLALEKRVNFSLNDLEVVSHGYSYFRTFFHVNDSSKKGSCENPARTNQSARCFFGRQIKTNQIPQYMGHYKRTCDLELWEIQRL